LRNGGINVYIGVKDVKAMPGYKLLLTFENNEVKVFDMSSYLDKGIFKNLKDEKMFSTVKVSFDTVEWDNGADLCPEILYHESTVQ
jgi:hypothetical protein